MKNPQPEYNPMTGIRAENEDDRPESLKIARQGFVNHVESFLDKMSDAYDEGRNISVPGGYEVPISDQPRIRHTFLGESSSGRTNTVARTIEPGVSLYGDGVTSPRVFEAVIPNEQRGISIIVITGTDPLTPKLEDGTVSYKQGKHSEIVSSVAVTNSFVTEDDSITLEEKYEVRGNGSVSVPSNPLEWETSVAMNHHERRAQGMNLGTMLVQEIQHSLLS